MPTVSIALALACAITLAAACFYLRRATWQAAPEDCSRKDNADRLLFLGDSIYGTAYMLAALACGAAAYLTLPAA